MEHAPCKSVVILGNPNVGKSMVFSRITGLGVVTANYPGTTIGVKTGKILSRGIRYELVDTPGIYSLDAPADASSDAERSAAAILDKADILLNVVDATNLERNLNLTVQIAKRRVPMVVCLNFWDETKHKGIVIDHKELARLLGVPVVPVSAQYNTGVKDLIEAFENAALPAAAVLSGGDWNAIGVLTERVQTLTHRHHTPLEFLSDITLHPAGGLVAALLVLGLTFWAIRSIGEFLVNTALGPLFERYYYPFITAFVSSIPLEPLRILLCGNGTDIMQSFGILTTGVYISIVLVFPYFFAFYLLIGILEDFGFLPRLAVTFDGLFHRIGIHGYSAIPIMLGLGCKVPAFMATRLLATNREKVITIALIMISAPCMPQSAMILSLGMQYGGRTVAAIFFTLFLVAIVTSLLLNMLIKGEPTDLFMDIPLYRIPSPVLMARKLWMRTLEYFKETIPMIATGVLIINLLDMTGAIRAISKAMGGLLAGVLGLPANIAPVLVLGFLRKDVSIAMLAPFHLSGGQFMVASVFLVLYLPCVASLFSIIREAGVANGLKIAGIGFAAAGIVAVSLRGVLSTVHIFAAR